MSNLFLKADTQKFATNPISFALPGNGTAL